MDGRRLRESGFDSSRKFSDDGELCERWIREFGGTFYISGTEVWESGKATLSEVPSRWSKTYGTSDHEVFMNGRRSGWTVRRSLQSISYPLRNEFLKPARGARGLQRIRLVPFLMLITSARYWGWARVAWRNRNGS